MVCNLHFYKNAFSLNLYATTLQNGQTHSNKLSANIYIYIYIYNTYTTDKNEKINVFGSVES